MCRNSIKASVCRIIGRQQDGHGEVLGTGCLIRSTVQGYRLQIATSNKIFQNSKDVKFFAIFTDVDGKQHELELGPPDKEYHNSAIAYFSVDKSGSKADAFLTGLQGSSRRETFKYEDMTVLIRTLQWYDKDEIATFRVLMDDHEQLLQLYVKNPEEKAGEFDGLAVQGSPILAFRGDEAQFWGIVELSEANKRLFKFFRHDSEKVRAHVQETQLPGSENTVQDPKLSIGDKLEKAWENQYFQDDLSKALDIKHSTTCGKKIQNWVHLAQEFNVSDQERNQITVSMRSPTSPTENMFSHLTTTKPNFLVKDLCSIFKDKKLHQVLRLINKSIEEEKLTPEDHVSELPDKDPDLMRKIILRLDIRDLWRRVATELKIPEQKCASFSRDPKFRPSRDFFTILRTQNPELTISKLRHYLEELHQKDILQHMKSIPDNTLLKDLSSEAALMCDIIEPKLNATENNLLYKLAELFQKDGFLKGVDIHDFGAYDGEVSQGSPTCAVIEYVISSMEIEYTIKDLVDRLLKIDRKDCVDIVKAYLKESKEVEQMVWKYEQLNLKEAEGFNHPPIAREMSYHVDDK